MKSFSIAVTLTVAAILVVLPDFGPGY